MRRALKIAAVNGALIVAALVAAELVFGSWIWGPDYSVLNIPRNTVRQFDVSQLYPSSGPVVYTRDEYGLRGPYPDPGKIDVLVMGGSTTNEIYVSDGLTWVDQLRLAFAKAGHPLVIVNAAVDGQSSLGHIRAIDLWFPNIPGLKARYVLVYVGINDLAVDTADMSQYDEMTSPELSRRFRYYLMNNSVLYNRFRQIRGQFAAERMRIIHGAMKTAGTEWRPAVPVVDPTALQKRLQPRLAAYAARLRTLAGKIRTQMKAEPIFVTQKRGDFKLDGSRLMARVEKGGKARTDEAYAELRAFDRTTLAVCREIEMFCVDLASELTFEDGDFYDQVHTTPAGSRRIGWFLHGRLKERLR